MMLEITTLLFVLCGVQSTETDHVCKASCAESFLPKCTGCLLPINPYGFFGRTVTLNCTLVDGNSSSSTLYYAWKNDEALPAEYQTVISPSTLQLNMPVIDNDEFKGTLMIQCLNNHSQPFPDITGIQVLTVDYPPHVSHLSAVCFNWKSLMFTWGEHYKHPADVNVSVAWTALGTNELFTCNDNVRMSCFIDNITSTVYSISITATNIKVGETYSTSLTVKPDKIVKPNPVISLRVASWTSRCVTLTWNHDQLLVKELNFSVAIMVDGSEVPSEMTAYNFTSLCGLMPATLYTFLVSAIPAAGGFWSDPQPINQTTREDVPSHGANLTGGNYLTQTCISNNQRRVKLYLKPPDKQYHNGHLTFFTALAVPSDGSNTISKQISISSTTAELKGLKCNVSYHVDVSASTAVGSSIPTRLNIPKEGVVEPPAIVRVPYNSWSVWVEWESGVTPRHWTIVWCRGDHDVCESDLDWMIVDGSLRSAVVPFSKPAGIIFAVSMTTAEGVSSKLTWSSCLYDVDNIPENKPSVPSVNTQPALGLTVTWYPDVCPQQTLITQYIIEHCINNYTSCKSSTVPSDQKTLVIENLKEGINYSVRLKPVAKAGTGPASDPVYAVPLDPNLSTGGIIAIAFACLFVVSVILSCMVCCYRYSCKKWKEKETITLPAVPNLAADSTTDITPIAFMPLPKFEERQKQTTLLTDRQLSGDSGRGSLTGGEQSPAPLSPSSQPPLKFEPVDEKEEQAKQGSGSELRSGGSLPRDYTKVADTKGGGHTPIITCLRVECPPGNPWSDSDESTDEECFNNRGYQEYVIAANKDEDEEQEQGVNPGFVPDEEGEQPEPDAPCQEAVYYGEEGCHSVPFTEGASDIDVQVTDDLSIKMTGSDNFCDDLKVPIVEHQYTSLAGGTVDEDVSTLKSQPEKTQMSVKEHSNLEDSHLITHPQVLYMALQRENDSYVDDRHHRTQPGIQYTSCQESRNPQIQSDTEELEASIPASRTKMTSVGDLDEGLGSCSRSCSSDDSSG